MTKLQLHELIDALPDNAVDRAAALLHDLTEGKHDPDQAWFWTPEWQAGEGEADREAVTDPGSVYDDADSFLASLMADREADSQ